MKVLLIFLFIVLAGYLVIHMCGGFSARRKKVIRQLQGLDKSLMVLDNLVSLNDRDLSRLKGELKDLNNILEGGNSREGSESAGNRRKPGGPSSIRHTGPAPAGSKLSGKALLEKIRREAQTAISDESDNRRPSGFIPKIIVVNILLLIITILVMLI